MHVYLRVECMHVYLRVECMYVYLRVECMHVYLRVECMHVYLRVECMYVCTYVYGMRYSSLRKLNNVYTDASVEGFVCHCIKYSPMVLL